MAEDNKRPGPLDPADILAKLELIKQQVQQSMPEFDVPQPAAPEAPAKPVVAEPAPLPQPAPSQAMAPTAPPAAVAPSAPAVGGTTSAPMEYSPVRTGYKSFIEFELVGDLSDPAVVKQVQELTGGVKLARMTMDYTAGVGGSVPPAIPGDPKSNGQKVLERTRTGTSRPYEYDYKPGQMVVMTVDGAPTAVLRIKGNYRLQGYTADGSAVLLNRTTGETVQRPIADLAALEGYEAKAYGKKIYGTSSVPATKASDVLKPVEDTVDLRNLATPGKAPVTPQTKPSVAEIGLPEDSTPAPVAPKRGRVILSDNIADAAKVGSKAIWGDNVARSGLGGAAKDGRKLFKEWGIATKRTPSTDEGAYFKDTPGDEATLVADIDRVLAMAEKELAAGRDVYVQRNIGKGLAKLNENAPKLAGILSERLNKFYTENQGVVAPEKTTTATTPVEPVAPKKGAGKKTVYLSDRSTSDRWPDRPQYQLPKGERYIGVIGTSGRRVDSARLTAADFAAMVERVGKTVRATDVLISGGAAWADHVAVQLYLDGKVGGLVLHLPGNIDTVQLPGETPRLQFRHGGISTAGSTANYYHDAFAIALGMKPGDTLAQIQQAIDMGAVVTFGDGEGPAVSTKEMISPFIARNRWVAQDATTGLVTLTFNPSADGPADGGTANTAKEHAKWNKGVKQFHIDIRKISPDDTEPERIAKWQGVQAKKAERAVSRSRMVESARIDATDQSHYDQLIGQIRGASGEFGGLAKARRSIIAARQGRLLKLSQTAILPEQVLSAAAQLQAMAGTAESRLSPDQLEMIFPSDGSTPRIPNVFWDSTTLKGGKLQVRELFDRMAQFDPSAGLSLLRQSGLHAAFRFGIGTRGKQPSMADAIVLQALKSLGIPEETFRQDFQYRPKYALPTDPYDKVEKIHRDVDAEIERRIKSINETWAKIRKYADHPDIALPVHTITMLLRGIEADLQSELPGAERKDLAPATAELQRTRSMKMGEGEGVAFKPYRRSIFDAEIPGAFKNASTEVMAATADLADDPIRRYYEISRLSGPEGESIWEIMGEEGLEYDIHQKTSLYGGTVDTNPGYRRYVMDMDGVVPSGWLDLDERGLATDEFEGFQNRFAVDGYNAVASASTNLSKAMIGFHVSADPSAGIPLGQRRPNLESKLTQAIKAYIGKGPGGLRHGTTDYEAIIGDVIPYTRNSSSVLEMRDGLRSRFSERIVVLAFQNSAEEYGGIFDVWGPKSVVRINNQKYYVEDDVNGSYLEIAGRKIYLGGSNESVVMAFSENDPVVIEIMKDPEFSKAVLTEPFKLGDTVQWPGLYAGSPDTPNMFKLDVDPVVHQTFRHTSPLVKWDGRPFQGAYVPAIQEYDTPEVGGDPTPISEWVVDQATGVSYIIDENGMVTMEADVPSTHVFDDYTEHGIYSDGVPFAIANEVAPGLTVDRVNLIERILSEDQYDALRRGQIGLDQIADYPTQGFYEGYTIRTKVINIPSEEQVIDPLTGKPYAKKLAMPPTVEYGRLGDTLPQQVGFAGETSAEVRRKQEAGLPTRGPSDAELDYEALVLDDYARNHFGQEIRDDFVDTTLSDAAAAPARNRNAERVRLSGYDPMATPPEAIRPEVAPIRDFERIRTARMNDPLPEAAQALRDSLIRDYMWLLRTRSTDAAMVRGEKTAATFRDLVLERTLSLARATSSGQYREILFSHADRVASAAFTRIAVRDILEPLNDDPTLAEPVTSIFKKVYDEQAMAASTRDGAFAFDRDERQARRQLVAAQEDLRKLMSVTTELDGQAKMDIEDAKLRIEAAQNKLDMIVKQTDQPSHSVARALAKNIARALLLERSADETTALSIEKIYQQIEDQAQMAEEVFQRDAANADLAAPAAEQAAPEVINSEMIERLMAMPTNERKAAVVKILNERKRIATKPVVEDPMKVIMKAQEGAVRTPGPDPVVAAEQTLAKAKSSLADAKRRLKGALTAEQRYATEAEIVTKERLVTEAQSRLAYAKSHQAPVEEVVAPKQNLPEPKIKDADPELVRYIKRATPEQLAQLRDDTWMLLSQHLAADGDYDGLVRTMDSYLRLGDSRGKSLTQGMNLVFDNNGAFQIPSELLSYKNEAGATVHLRPQVAIKNPNIRTGYSRPDVARDFISIKDFSSFIEAAKPNISNEAYMQLATILQYVERVAENKDVPGDKKLGFYLGSDEKIGDTSARRLIVTTAPRANEDGVFWASQQEAPTPYNGQGASFDSDYMFNEFNPGRLGGVTADSMERLLREMGASDFLQVKRRAESSIEQSVGPESQKQRIQPFDIDVTAGLPIAKEMGSIMSNLLVEGAITQEEFDVFLKEGVTWDNILNAIEDPVLDTKGSFKGRMVAYKLLDAAIRARFSTMFDVVLARAGVSPQDRAVAVPSEWKDNNPFEVNPEDGTFRLRPLDSSLEHAAGPFTLKEKNWHQYSWEEEAFKGNPLVSDFIKYLRRENNGINPREAEQLARNLEQIIQHRQEAMLSAEALGTEPMGQQRGRWMPKIGGKAAVAGGTVAGTLGAYLLAKSDDEKEMALAGAPVQAGFEVLSRAVGGAPAAAVGLGLTYAQGGDMLRAISGMAGSIAGGFLGGAAGLIGGPVGGFAGGLAGSTAGYMAADTLYSAIAGDRGAPVPANVGQLAPNQQTQAPMPQLTAPQQPQQGQTAGQVDTSTALGQAKMLEGI